MRHLTRLFLLVFFMPLFAQAGESLNVTSVGYQQLNGMPLYLSQYKGKWILVNYWATWCPPCRAEMPDLEAFYKANKDKAVVIGVNYEVGDTQKVKDFIKEYGITFPIVRETLKIDGVNTSLGIQLKGLPTSVIISPKGNLLARHTGGLTREIIEGFIKKAEKEGLE